MVPHLYLSPKFFPLFNSCVLNHRMARLEETSKIIKANLCPNTSTKPCHQYGTVEKVECNSSWESIWKSPKITLSQVIKYFYRLDFFGHFTIMDPSFHISNREQSQKWHLHHIPQTHHGISFTKYFHLEHIQHLP